MTLSAWIGGYRRAWESNDPDDILALFTPDAVFFTEPYATPFRGHEEIVAGWLAKRDEPGAATFTWEPVTETPELGVIRARTDYPALGETYSNLWVICFAPDGRATEFTEWWMEHPR
ncbi:nuclear transport factor 2 family protein [Actinomadura rudentiformis]|uniref:Nuclear transport factor 2 family protein n=1 Tax=Actinomadura rudentiformis TaxID=359158 RepID=A0A6H9YA17_9ACTN|nr:nuclear transport factor 2 family protein [Actinomadura rudentiformis]KAB2341370.1 nuclear transport factor 2 family protein [Actinomadura rudentiformis]